MVVTDSSKPSLSEALHRWKVPFIVFALALAIRMIGIGWGLKNDLHNQSYHPDEEDIFRFSQQVEPAHLKFTPGIYNYGTFYLTELKIASDMTAAYTGAPDPKNPDSTWSYIARCNLAGRILSACAGAGTVVVLFLIALRLFGFYGGLASAAILAVAPAHVVHSRFQTVDVTAVFLLALSVLFAFKLLPNEGEDPPNSKEALKWIILAGVFAGFSAGTKYTGILGLISILVVLAACRRSTAVKDGLIAIGATLAAFILSCPGIILDNEAFMRDFKYEMLHTSTAHGLVFEGTANGFVYHFANLLQGFGSLATLLGVCGLLYAASRKHVWAIALLAFLLPYYLLIGRAEVKFIRYTFPMYVGLAVGFGWAVASGQKSGKRGAILVGAGIMAIGGLDYGGLIGTARFTGYMIGEDPRDTAARYLKDLSRSRPDTLVGLPEDPWFWSAPLFPDSTIARRDMSPKKRYAEMQFARAPRVTYYLTPEGRPSQFDKRLITDVKPDFVTYSSIEYMDPMRLKGRSDISDEGKAIAAQFTEFTAALQTGYDQDKSFGDDVSLVQDLAYVQPHVVVWKRKTP